MLAWFGRSGARQLSTGTLVVLGVWRGYGRRSELVLSAERNRSGHRAAGRGSALGAGHVLSDDIRLLAVVDVASTTGLRYMSSIPRPGLFRSVVQAVMKTAAAMGSAFRTFMLRNP